MNLGSIKLVPLAEEGWYNITLTQGVSKYLDKIFSDFEMRLERVIRTSFGDFHAEEMLDKGKVVDVSSSVPKELEEKSFATFSKKM